MGNVGPLVGVDRSDPCALLSAMEEVLDRLLAGELVVRARVGEDERQWQQSDVPGLRIRINELRRKCAAQQTGKPRVSTIYVTSSKGI